MNPTTSDKESLQREWSRRSVLRRAAAATVAVGIGVPALSGTGAAAICPRSPGYWMNHDWPGDGDDPDVEENTGLEQVNQNVPGVFFETEREAQMFLGAPAGGDKGHKMAVQLTATVLNYQFISSACVTAPVADVDGDGDPEPINRIVHYAQQWLLASGWSNDGGALRSWEIDPGPQFTTDADGEVTFVTDGKILRDYLDAFNNDGLVLAGCECEDGTTDPDDSDEEARGDTSRRAGRGSESNRQRERDRGGGEGRSRGRGGASGRGRGSRR